MATIQDLGKVAYFNKGVYNSETSYEINDVVSYNGSSYVSLGNNNQGNLPTNATYWSVVALKGDKGDTGKPFVIEKTYESIEDMVADYDNMQINDYVMIQGSIEDEENATLWTKTETEVSPYKWVYLADFSGASGITGQTPNIQIGTVTEGNEPAVTRRAGSSNENPILDFVLKTGAKGDTGATGNGISNVSKTGTSDLTDTYTITYTNGNSTTFDVSNGKGIVSIVKTGTSGLVDTYTITYNDGTTSTYTVTNGEDGEVTQAQLDETNSEVELLKKIYNAFPTTSGEDEIVTLNGTAEVNFKNIDLKGNTSQETTTGKNILPQDKYIASQTINGITYTNNGDGTFNLNGTATANISLKIIDTGIFNLNVNQEYYLYCSENYNSASFNMSIITSENGSNKYFVVNSSYAPQVAPTNSRLQFYIESGNTVNVQNVKLMLVKGADDTSYEPYTNGASPNPDYPQEVKVVTGNNTIKVEGKNLFDKNNYNSINAYISSTGELTSNDQNKTIYISCKPSTTYTVSRIQPTSGNNKFGVGYTSLIPTGGSQCDGFTRDYTTNSITITTDSNTKYLVVWCWVADYTITLSEMLSSIQIEENSSATTYTPYTSQSYPLNLGSMELCKIGNYQDYIYKNNDKWYKYSMIGKVNLTGNETISRTTTNTTDAYRFCIDIGTNIYTTTNTNEKAPFYCNKFINVARVDTWYNTNGIGPSDNVQSTYKSFVIYYDETKAMTNIQFLNWLSENNVTVYYPLATPTTTEITDTTLIGQLNDLERTYSYEEQTTISQTNSNKPFIITAEAILSLKDILNS